MVPSGSTALLLTSTGQKDKKQVSQTMGGGKKRRDIGRDGERGGIRQGRRERKAREWGVEMGEEKESLS